MHAANKQLSYLNLPSSGLFPAKVLVLVRQQKNHLPPGVRARLVEESQLI